MHVSLNSKGLVSHKWLDLVTEISRLWSNKFIEPATVAVEANYASLGIKSETKKLCDEIKAAVYFGRVAH